MIPRRKHWLGRMYVLAAALVIAVVGLIVLLRRPGKPQPTKATPTASHSTVAASFDKKQHSLTDSTSPWVIANKRNPIGTYAPSDLVVPHVALRLANGGMEMQMRREPAAALEQLFAHAKQDGYNLLLASGYRSRSFQSSLYNGYVSKDGQAAADRYSARPGYSEHQTGLAVDVGRSDRRCEVEQCFANLPEGQWLAAHAHEHGFVIRYPDGKEPVTGYGYEPWHIRYVGKHLAAEIHKTGQTLEEFFGLPHAPSYQ